MPKPPQSKGPDGLTDAQRGFRWGSPSHIMAVGGKPGDTLEMAFHRAAMARSAARLEKFGGDAGQASKIQ